MAAQQVHPVETIGMLRKRGTDLEAGLAGGGEEEEIGGEPTYGHGEFLSMIGGSNGTYRFS